MSRLPRAGAAAAVALAMLAAVFREQLAHGFGKVFGGDTDGRIAIALHEHWVGVLRGAWSWSRPPWFFPHAKTLAYNDGYLLHGLIYAPARLLGADPGLAANLTHAALLLLMFAGVALLARRQFGVSFAWSLFAGATACVANSWYGRLGHVQLLAFGPALLVAVLLMEALGRIAQGRLRAGLGYGAGAAVLFGALMLTSGYVAWMGALFGGLIMIAAALRGYRALLGWPLQNFAAVAAIGVLFILAASPAVWLYAAVLGGGAGGHPVWAIRELAPSPADLHRLGATNLMWGWADPPALGGEFRPGQNQPPGFTPMFAITALLAIGAALAGLRRRTPGAAGVAAVGVLSLVFVALATDFGSVWGWGAMLRLPGAAGMRDLSRIPVLAGAMLVGCVAWGLWRLAHRAPLVAGLVAVLILAEQANTRIHADYDPRADAARWAAAPPPPGCAAFVPSRPRQGMARNRIEGIYDHNTEAMFGATLTQLPTIAGFNSSLPPDWNFADPNGRHYDRRVRHYARAHGLAESLCGINLASMTWTGPGRPIDWLARPVPPVPYPGRIGIGQAGPQARDWLASGWSDPEPWGVWSEGAEAELILPLPPGWSGGGRVRLWLRGFAPRTGQRVVTLSAGEADQVVTLRHDADLLVELPFAEGQAVVDVTLDIPGPIRPVDIGMGGDSRSIGVGLLGVELVAP
ncbi:hypothetical protein C8P66_1361 [Humitalea rosea]|uniref:DUF7024 domain-containing protein n=1 Tax=Humitalea rosea TaxID=990373 RepID=A0A2W7IH67_9PROT|nr:hypothetical protein [Humitalea rosea]PZW38647.1 hypothetical protein C8P66_1361 [Humitalea rosea]